MSYAGLFFLKRLLPKQFGGQPRHAIAVRLTWGAEGEEEKMHIFPSALFYVNSYYCFDFPFPQRTGLGARLDAGSCGEIPD